MKRICTGERPKVKFSNSFMGWDYYVWHGGYVRLLWSFLRERAQ